MVENPTSISDITLKIFREKSIDTDGGREIETSRFVRYIENAAKFVISGSVTLGFHCMIRMSGSTMRRYILLVKSLD